MTERRQLLVVLLLTTVGLLLVHQSQAFATYPIRSPFSKVLFPRTTDNPIRATHKNDLHYTTSTSTSLSMSNSGNNQVQGSDRIISCLPYLLPLMDGDRYGRFIFALVPALGMADTLLLGPFKLLYFSIPFGQFVAFLALSFLSRNPELSRPLRFNLQQALLLDILLIFPSLFGRLPFAMPRILIESGSNFVFYVLVACVGYALFSNLTGKLPNQIPVVSEASEMQIGPF